MAAAAPIIAAIAAPTITGAITRIGLSLAISFITNKLFAPDAPEAGSFEQAPDQGVVQRISTNTSNKLPVVYGEARTFGSITFADITSDNQRMAFIIPLCEGPIQAINNIYWDSYQLTLDGTANQTLLNVTNATDGTGKTNDFLNGNLRIAKYPFGGRCTQMQTFSSRWNTNSDRRTMPNIAYLYVELDYNREKQITGLTSKLGADIQGKQVRNITKSGNNPAQFGSLITDPTNNDYNNPALCLADYLTDTRYGCGNIIKIADLDLETFNTHKNFCNNMVSHTPAGGGSDEMGLRYRSNGVANTNDSRDIIISDLTTNSQSVFAYQLGKYQVLADTISSSQMSFDSDNTYGDVTIVNDGVNTLRNKMSASFVSKANRNKEQQVFVEADSSVMGNNETELTQDLRFKFINTNIEAQRALNVILNKTRETLVVSFNTDSRAFSLQVNDVITYTNSVYGFNDKLFRVNSISETQLNGELGGYTLTCQEYNALVYNPGAITADQLSPNTNLPNPNNIGTPGKPVVLDNPPTVLQKSNGQVRLQFTTPSTVSNINTFEVFSSSTINGTRIHIDTIGLAAGSYSANATVTSLVSNVPNGVNYFSVRGVSSLGNVGPYSENSNPLAYTRTINPEDDVRANNPALANYSNAQIMGNSLGNQEGREVRVYAYTRGTLSGTTYSKPADPPARFSGSLTVTPALTPGINNNVLTTLPSTTNTTYYNSLDNENLVGVDTIYRIETVYRITGTTATPRNTGWSRPILLTLPQSDGISGLANLTRYGAFSSDVEAILNSPTTANGLSDRWVSNPDLLGIQNNNLNDPVPFTHTITQFGDVEDAGLSTTRQYELSGSFGAQDGNPYTRTITYNGPTPTTRWTGTQLTSYIVDVDTGITNSSSMNTSGSGAGYQTTETGGSFGYLADLSSNDGGDIGTIPTDRFLAMEIVADGTTYRFNSNRPAPSGTPTFETFVNAFASIENVNSLSFSSFFRNTTGGVTRFIQPFHRANDITNDVLFKSSSAVLNNITEIRLGYSPSSTTGFAGSRFVNNFSPGLNRQRYEYNFDFHSGLNLTITRNGENVPFTSPGIWTNTEPWSAYLSRLRNNLIASQFITSAITTGTNNENLRITFVSDAANYGVSISVNNNGNYNLPSLTDVDPTTVGETAAKSWILRLSPTVPDDINYTNIVNTTQWRYSDSYLNNPIIDTYTGNETNLSGLITTIANRLNILSHITATTTGADNDQLLLTYTAIANYSSPQTGASSGFDGRNPNMFINFGVDSSGADIMNIPVPVPVIDQIGVGLGELVTDIPTCNFQTYTNGTFDNYELAIDNNYVPIFQQLINAATVLYYRTSDGDEGLFNPNINGNTLTLTSKTFDITPGITLFNSQNIIWSAATTYNSGGEVVHTINGTTRYYTSNINNNLNNVPTESTDGNWTIVSTDWMSDELSVTGDNFSTTFLNGSGSGNLRTITIQRNKSISSLELYDISPPQNLETINARTFTSLDDIVNAISQRGSKLGIYVTDLTQPGATNKTIRIQDIGTSKDDIVIGRNDFSELTINEVNVSEGKRPTLASSGDNSFSSDRWSRPVNTGRAV